MIERDLSEPDRIVGELLQPGGYLKLLELGIEGIWLRIRREILFHLYCELFTSNDIKSVIYRLCGGNRCSACVWLCTI